MITSMKQHFHLITDENAVLFYGLRLRSQKKLMS